MIFTHIYQENKSFFRVPESFLFYLLSCLLDSLHQRLLSHFKLRSYKEMEKKKNSYTYTQRKHVATKQDASYIVVSSCRGTETWYRRPYNN